MAYPTPKGNVSMLNESMVADDRPGDPDSLYRSNLPTLRNDTEGVVMQG